MNAYFSYKIILAAAVTVYTLVFSFTALIPVYSSKGEPKNVSAVMWITPIVGNEWRQVGKFKYVRLNAAYGKRGKKTDSCGKE